VSPLSPADPDDPPVPDSADRDATAPCATAAGSAAGPAESATAGPTTTTAAAATRHSADQDSAVDATGGQPRTESARDPVLAAERQHLLRSRECLVRMQARAAEAGDVGVDAFASEALGAARARRLRALADDPSVPPFFGRLDRSGDAEHPDGETFHIGRRHVRDDAGDPLVIDWRAPMSRAFYRATPADPMGVRRRRRFGFSSGALTSYEDEPLTLRTASQVAATESRILLEEIERPRVGPMRDIVATIQPDQDDLVRAALEDTICVQGAPGTGKTAVGLHRAAYLLYTYPARLRRSGVLVVGPNRAFLGYIGEVLPALGEIGVTQSTVEELLAAVPIRATDPPEVAALKGDARMAEVLRRAVIRLVRRPEDGVVVVVGTRRYRIPPERLRRYVDDLRRGNHHYDVARERLHLLLAEDVRRQREEAGGAPSDAETARIARSAAVRDFVSTVWPPLDPATLVHDLLTDPDRLAAAARGLLDAAEQELLRWIRKPRSVRSAPWSAADAVLVDEVTGLLARPDSYGHVVLDEAQDLSPMQCRGIARRCPTGSLTVLGDLAQGTTAWSTPDWQVTLNHLGKPDARIEPLTRGYRVPADVIAFANRLLPHLAVGLQPATSVRSTAGGLQVRGVGEAAAAAAQETIQALAQEGSVGVIVADAETAAVGHALARAGVAHLLLGTEEPEEPEEPDQAAQRPVPRVSLVPATLAKGLEFDHVVVVEPAAIVEAEPRGLRRLYVVLTRAVSRLVVVHARPLPAELSG
jgi:DNA helicase IV